MSRRAPDYVQPSWAGSGLIEMRRGGERFYVRDTVLVTLGVLALYAAAYGIGLLFLSTTPIACGVHCYRNPHASMHNLHLYLWLTVASAVVALAASYALRVARVVVSLLQVVILTVMLIIVVPALHRADIQQQHLDACQYGARPPCIGMTRLS